MGTEMRVITRTYSENLKLLRSRHRYSQSKVANLLNISRQAYQLKESGKKDFTYSEIKRLGEIFNISPGEIFFNNELPNEQQIKHTS